MLYILMYVIVPLACLLIFVVTHYEAITVENGCYGVKLDKSDPTYHYYSIDAKKMKLYDIYWEMYDVHKLAYKKIVDQIKNGGSNDGSSN